MYHGAKESLTNHEFRSETETYHANRIYIEHSDDVDNVIYNSYVSITQ